MYDRSLVWTLSPLLAQPVIDSPKQPLFDWGFLLIHGQASAIRIRIARTLIGKRKINVRCMLKKKLTRERIVSRVSRVYGGLCYLTTMVRLIVQKVSEPTCSVQFVVYVPAFLGASISAINSLVSPALTVLPKS